MYTLSLSYLKEVWNVRLYKSWLPRSPPLFLDGKYIMSEPKRYHPVFVNSASFFEYISGFIPQEYRESLFTRLTMLNLYVCLFLVFVILK